MEVLLNFILKSGIGLLTLYLFYYALLRNETNFRFNRLYLLLAPLVALTLPLIKWPAFLSPDTAVAQTLQAIQLSEVTVVAYGQPATGAALLQFITPANLVLGLYLLVALFLAFKLCRQLWHIRRLKSKAITIEQTPDAVQIVQLGQHYSSFAFLNYVFLSSQEQLNPRERQQVLAHELAHVQLGHTYDILLYEVLSIALWFNPLIWFLKKELRNLHEYQADACVLEQHQLNEYRVLLSKEVLFNMGLPVGSHFQKPQVLQRLHMLKRHGKRPGWLKPLLTLPLFVVLLLSLSSQQVAADIATQLTSPAHAAPSNETSSESINLDKDSTKLPESQAKADAKMPILRDDTPADMPVQEDKPTDNIHNLHLRSTNPYTYVEQMPMFKGGEAEMIKFLGKNIRYPEEAKEAGLEGIVVLSFVVDHEGRLDDIQVIKRLGKGTDEEAVRVVKMMSGNWLPGKQNGKVVPVRYTLPVRYTIK
ncbi:TonB family protein [Pontibacter toksunensis]|uniref:TonB family protein n=1 Tax=Pontibacter toksunensis TaxID=1332631 RepID=A0ABW6BXM7_9BACT